MFCCDVKHSKQHSKVTAQEMSLVAFGAYLKMGGHYDLFFYFAFLKFVSMVETNSCKDNCEHK